MAWFDKRPVCLLSTVHKSGEVNKRIRDRNEEGGFRNIAKPIAVDGYNAKMGGGVDRNDQMNSLDAEHVNEVHLNFEDSESLVMQTDALPGGKAVD